VNNKELLLWDGVKGYALDLERNLWSFLPENPNTSDSISSPHFLNLSNGKILAIYWKSNKHYTLCLDCYHSDKKQWERVRTISVKMLEPFKFYDPNLYTINICGVANMNGNAVICIGTAFGHYMPTTCIIIEDEDKINLLSTENAPRAGSVSAVYSFGDKLLLCQNNFWSFGCRVWDQKTNTWQKTEGYTDPWNWDFKHTPAGNKLYIFGGTRDKVGGHTYKKGRIYSFTDNKWRDWPLGESAPEGRYRHGICWTGKEIIILGGVNISHPEGSDWRAVWLNDGASFNPETSKWETLPQKNAPPPRAGFRSFWTGKEMIIWGGRGHHPFNTILYDGYAYNPETKTWRKLPSLADFIKR